MSLASPLWTQKFTTDDSPVTITADSGIEYGSIKVSSDGAATIIGTAKKLGLVSEAVPLAAGDVFNFGNSLGITSFTIAITSGEIYIVGF